MEPTSGLDPNQIVEIREVIKGWGNAKRYCSPRISYSGKGFATGS